jgi:hypothetical protein
MRIEEEQRQLAEVEKKRDEIRQQRERERTGQRPDETTQEWLERLQDEAATRRDPERAIDIITKRERDRQDRIDRASTREVTVNGKGKIEVDFKNMPNGVNGKAKGDGLFKETRITRQTQMQPAEGEE